jgi:iron complex transport system substrate-binding protein
MRICTLYPAATEIVFALGLGDEVVAVSHECDYPPGAARLPKLTRSNIPSDLCSSDIDRIVSSTLAKGASLYSIDLDVLRAAAPDTVISQDLCNVCAVSNEELDRCLESVSLAPDVLNLRATSLQGILSEIASAAAFLNRNEAGERLLASLHARIQAVRDKTKRLSYRPRVFCMEWVSPPYCGGHWMKKLVEIAGGHDGLSVDQKPSVRIEWQEVVDFAPDVIVLTCCGYDVARSAAEGELLPTFPGANRVPAIQQGQIYATDSSSYFARPGPRIVDSLEILAHIIHPDVFPPPKDANAFRRVDLAEHPRAGAALAPAE